MQLQQQTEALKQHDLHPYLISFDSPGLAKRYREQTQLSWPILLDPERSQYQAYLMQRSHWLNIIRPSSIAKYLWLLFRGRRLQESGSDYLQLGGDVLIDPAGIVRYHHICRDPHDRPSVEMLLNEVG